MNVGQETPNSSKRKEKRKLLVGVTGSVAAIKLEELLRSLIPNFDVRVVITKSARAFVETERISEGNGILIFGDEDEWKQWKQKGDPVLHIDLRNWADMLLIAPLSANSLAKIASGLCDNLLTCIFRAWDFSKPVIIAPAMNTTMWNSLFTERHMKTMDELGVHVIAPVYKTLACGEVGLGAMAPVEDITRFVMQVQTL